MALPVSTHSSLLPDDEVNIDAGVNSEVSDFLNHAWGAVNIDHSLVNAHLEAVPCLGTLTARWLTGGDSENLGRNANGTLSVVTLVLSSSDDLTAGTLERLDFSASEGHSIKWVSNQNKRRPSLVPSHPFLVKTNASAVELVPIGGKRRSRTWFFGSLHGLPRPLSSPSQCRPSFKALWFLNLINNNT